MRYMMKQKLFSWGDDFTIKDQTGKDCYFVDGKAFSLGNQLSFQDMSGNELVYIDQKLLTFSPKYEIYKGGQLYATVSKELFTFFNCRFTIDVPGPNDLEAEGDFSIIGMHLQKMGIWSLRYQKNGSHSLIPMELRLPMAKIPSLFLPAQSS